MLMSKLLCDAITAIGRGGKNTSGRSRAYLIVAVSTVLFHHFEAVAGQLATDLYIDGTNSDSPRSWAEWPPLLLSQVH